MGVRIRAYILTITLLCFGLAKAQAYAREYRVALVLPFNANGAQATLTEAMLDYYEGFKMAAMDLEAEGLKLKLYVFDSQKDSQHIQTVFDHPDMKKMDVIVGPIYAEDLKIAEAFCNKHNILLVSPLKFYSPELPKSRVINFFIPDSIRCISIAEKCVRYYPKFQYVVVSDNTTESQQQAAIIKKRLQEISKRAVKSVSYSAGKLSSTFTGDSIILIATMSTKDGKSAMLKSVKYVAHAYVLGQMNWHNPSQSCVGIDEPRMIYPEVNFVSHSDTFATRFRNAFFDIYYGEPSKYAYIGYDHATYLCYGLMTFGRDFDKHLPDAEYRGLINVIRLKKTKNNALNLGLNYIHIVEEERQEYAP